MRDSKTILLLSISFLLLVMSFVLLWTWWHGIVPVQVSNKVGEKPAARLITPQPDTMISHYTGLLHKMEQAFDTLQKKQAQGFMPPAKNELLPKIPAPQIPAETPPKPVMQQAVAMPVKESEAMTASQLQLNAAAGSNILTGTMMLRMNSNHTDPEVVIVIQQPDGKVIQKNSWESGLIQTAEGRSIYSCKVRLDAPVGEFRKVNVALETVGLQPGVYTFRVYHEGVLIGKKTNRLIA